MGKYTLLLIAYAMPLLMGCTGEKAKDTGGPVESNTKAKVEVKEPEQVAIATETQIVCDKFKLVTKLTDSTLDLSVDTDLPDNTVVMVTVSRSYGIKGDSNDYPVDYFKEKGVLEKWKSIHKIPVDSKKWKSALLARQEKMSRLGVGFDVASISDKITVRVVVPMRQPNPGFGDENANLRGKAVRTKGARVVDDEVEIIYSLDSLPTVTSPPSLNPLELKIDQSYIVSKQTPLMPSHSPEDPIAAIQQMKQIPKGGGFNVLEMVKKKNNPWYKVTAFDQNNTQIGTGWVNSTALFGQELKASK